MKVVGGGFLLYQNQQFSNYFNSKNGLTMVSWS